MAEVCRNHSEVDAEEWQHLELHKKWATHEAGPSISAIIDLCSSDLDFGSSNNDNFDGSDHNVNWDELMNQDGYVFLVFISIVSNSLCNIV